MPLYYGTLSDYHIQSLKTKLTKIIARLMDVAVDAIDIHSSFSLLGVRGKKLGILAELLNKEFDFLLSPAIFFEYPNIKSLAEHLAKPKK